MLTACMRATFQTVDHRCMSHPIIMMLLISFTAKSPKGKGLFGPDAVLTSSNAG